MPEVVRANVDKHVGHASPTPNGFHKTAYKSGGNTKVYVEGQLGIVDGDKTGCGDPVASFSGKVFFMGKGVHRKGDATGGHGSWVPNSAASGSSKVKAG